MIVSHNARRAALAIAVVCGSIVASTGCSRQDLDRAGSSLASAVPALASAAPAVANDAFVVARIESKLVAIDGDSALHVAVASHGGAVRLSGRTKSQAIALHFTEAARTIAGVRSVRSELVVDTKLPSTAKAAADFALATAVRTNLIAQGGLNGVGIGVDVSSGAVTLRGHVKTESLKATLLDAARATSGVRAVTDRLAVGS